MSFLDFLELAALALALSMDAFAVAISKGLAASKVSYRQMLIVGAWFGGFQALMPLLGYFLADCCEKYIETYIPWISFALLLLIGLNMLREAIWGDDDEETDSFGFKTMLVMAIATSIDAMASGVTLFADGVNIFLAVAIIGVFTFVLSAFGVKVGHVFGAKYQKGAEIAGGLVLVLLALETLLENIGVLPW